MHVYCVRTKNSFLVMFTKKQSLEMAILNPLSIILMLLCTLALQVSHLIRQNHLSDKCDPVNDYQMPTNSTRDPCE